MKKHDIPKNNVHYYIYTVPLGVLPKNENLGDDMVDILLHLHQYVPLVQTTKSVHVPVTEEEVDVSQASFRRILWGGGTSSQLLEQGRL